MPVSNVLWGIGGEEGEVGGGLCDGEGEGVAGEVAEVREVGLRRNDEVGGEGEEVLESEGERVFESGECCLEEVVGGVVKLVEEDALHGDETTEPWNVEEGEGKSGCGNGTWWWSNLASIYNCQSVVVAIHVVSRVSAHHCFF